MDILHSAWLIKMLKKSGQSPQERLLSLFDILADWIDAPNIRTGKSGKLTMGSAAISAPNGAYSLDGKTSSYMQPGTLAPEHLLDYLSEQARACGAQLPEALAQQLYFIAMGALQESMHGPEHSHLADFGHAKLAAKALIAAQTEQPRAANKMMQSKPLVYGIVASIFVMGMAGGLLLYHSNTESINSLATSALLTDTDKSVEISEYAPSPKMTAEMYATLEQMRKGDCRYIEALLIPAADKKVYLENVVGGRVPDNAHDMAIAQKYLQKISCSYGPMLMKNSVN